jgi:hypothetical protein
MKNMRVFGLVLILLLAAAESPAPVQGSNDCPPDMDAGTIVCGSRCYTSDTCRYSEDAPVGTYCWLAYSTTGSAIIGCHDGVYDPCCDPDYQW